MSEAGRKPDPLRLRTLCIYWHVEGDDFAEGWRIFADIEGEIN